MRSEREFLRGVPSGQQGDAHLLAAQEAPGRRVDNHVMIDTRRERRYDVAEIEAPGRGRVQLLSRHGPQSRDGRMALSLRESEAARARFLKILERPVFAIPECAAFSDRFVEQSMREGRSHQNADGHGAGGFAEQSDVIGIAAKTRDIGFDPTQRRQLILKPVIAGRRFRIEIGMGEKAEDAETIVEADDDDALGRQEAAVGGGIGRGAELKAAPVNPHHHGPLLVRQFGGGPDVEGEQSSSRGPGRASFSSAERHAAPNVEASRTPFQGVGGCGARQRSGPTGGAAYGMPLNASTPLASRWLPRTSPACVRTCRPSSAAFEVINASTVASPCFWRASLLTDIYRQQYVRSRTRT